MKKIALTFMFCFMLLTGCSSVPTIPASSGSVGNAADWVRPTQLSDEQKEIVNLLKFNQDIILFDFNVLTPYTNMEVWIDVYQNGKLIESKAADLFLSDSPNNKWVGKLAVTAEKDPYQWALTFSADGSTIHVGSIEFEQLAGSSYASNSITGTTQIEAGKNILLHSWLFTDKNGIKFYNSPSALENPEILKEYSYAHLLFCKFFNE